ncbi:type IV pilus modification protein PilV [Thiobacillus sp.]|jgi:type IV pilus assembly protein PilV|uniref:type IV pilus modification protein PilV n=1 Tax=Thiobacillus sp. TaxID=924 RepID=UPI0025D74ED4|nr:type IV pilus modification protein PilV [Thiobacillus sp.]
MINHVSRQAGFTLLEVLIALLVISIGLLGIAGMQALAINNTSIARVQSLAALQAASLASAMQANEAYWTNGSLANTNVNGAVLSDAILNGQAVDCRAAACTPVQMAGWDLKQWGGELAQMLPGGNGRVICTQVVGTPITCAISVIWQEKNVALNAATGTEAGALATGTAQQQTYSMVVQP